MNEGIKKREEGRRQRAEGTVQQLIINNYLSFKTDRIDEQENFSLLSPEKGRL
ncbi:hypothetical protein [Okeania sp. KiyG1]|uniref:hypothetical protein n=1 Tax=Okeania sp. KiyG1 TaxID=2720165 RepID=UPI0019212061|nr:hypothetical protein [Okeania sp. KiyG1]GGA41484.1 hypothetical protein CYANOKiyG1_59900 [Okeania sp. KiyG1]